MTTDELTDWHAKREGWRFLTVEDDRANADDPIGIKCDSWVRKGASYFPEVRSYFPFPATIDGAASALPPGWVWYKFLNSWNAGTVDWPIVKCDITDDEVHDRYLLAKLAWEATAAKWSDIKPEDFRTFDVRRLRDDGENLPEETSPT
jgi:hypothetical protein